MISPPSTRAKSRNWLMMRSISSMSVIMPSLVDASLPLISMPSRMRDSGVRRSCDTPARISARSSSRRARSRDIWLKARVSVATSVGPVSSMGAGCRPWPISMAAWDKALSGRLRRETIRPAAARDSSSATEPQPSHCSVAWRSMRSRGRRTQYSSSSIVKVTQKPGTPLRCMAKRVCAPRTSRTSSMIMCTARMSGGGSMICSSSSAG